MNQFRKEIVRWNRQINLVSRQDTSRRVAGLIIQCQGAWRELVTHELAGWDANDSISYYDLGSGGGLPGFVWHQLLVTRFTAVNTWLVEPREKRAWFLARLNHITPDQPLQVWNARWGDVKRDAIPPSTNMLISLKALHLTDPEVFGGLARATQGADMLPKGEVVIARFYPPEQKWNAALAAELEIGKAPLQIGSTRWRPARQRILSPAPQQRAGASLVVSAYQIVT